MDNLLYRFINWNDVGSKRLLSENELHFYSAQKWEKDGEYQFELLEFTERAVFEIVLDIAIDMHNTNFDEYVLWMNFHAQKYGIDLNSLISVELDLADQYFAGQIAKERASNPDKFIEVQKQLYFDRTGIISLSKNKYSYSLWSSKRNASGDNIICLGLDIAILRKVLEKVPNCFMDEVAYSDELKKYQLVYDKTGYKSLIQLLNISFSLKTDFKLEEEVRIQRLLLDNSENSPERTILLPNEIFKEIIIFKDAHEVTQSEVSGLAEQKGIPKIQYADILYDDNSISVHNA
jgi:hypothetical protein